MNKITCIAIDDEPLALGLVVGYIEKTPFLELHGQFDNPLDAMEFMETNPVQLLFLDIQMPDLIGTDFARILDKKSKVIFTTAYDNYAVEGFKLEALDYLLKPISYEIFLNSAQRAKKYFELFNSKSNHANSSISSDEEYLFIKADYKIRRIHYSDILYFEGLKDYIQLYLKSTKAPLIFHATIKSVEAKLPSERFMRVHRSFIVNLYNVRTIERSKIVYGKQRIPISENYKKIFDEFIKKKFL